LTLPAQDLTALRPQSLYQPAAAILVSADCETNSTESAPLAARRPFELRVAGLRDRGDPTSRSSAIQQPVRLSCQPRGSSWQFVNMF
jgi:hypothetical protein